MTMATTKTTTTTTTTKRTTKRTRLQTVQWKNKPFSEVDGIGGTYEKPLNDRGFSAVCTISYILFIASNLYVHTCFSNGYLVFDYRGSISNNIRGHAISFVNTNFDCNISF
jgi:hypothetical protein